MQRCADISRKYSDDDCFDEMKGEKLRMQGNYVRIRSWAEYGKTGADGRKT